MSRGKRKVAKRSRRAGKGSPSPPSEDYLPDPAAVKEVKELVSPKGKRYTVLVTTELDEYDPPQGDGHED